jgi:hypothetical protein
MTDLEMRAVSRRIEALVVELAAVQDVAVRCRIEELIRLLMQLHAEAVARMLAMMQIPGFEARDGVERFAADPVVASVLMLHDLHPHDVRTRVEKALDLLRGSLGTQVQLAVVTVNDDFVRVRVDATPGGCATPIEGIRATVDAAIRDAAPAVGSVEVEAAIAAAPPTLIQVTRR